MLRLRRGDRRADQNPLGESRNAFPGRARILRGFGSFQQTCIETAEHRVRGTHQAHADISEPAALAYLCAHQNARIFLINNGRRFFIISIVVQRALRWYLLCWIHERVPPVRVSTLVEVSIRGA